MEFCFETFLRLKERRRPLAGTRILLVDEPFVGLALILVARMIDKITELTAALGLTVLMAEQNFEQATRIAARGYVLVHGRVILAADSVAALRSSEVVRRLSRNRLRFRIHPPTPQHRESHADQSRPRAIAEGQKKLSNWGRWGKDDQIGTLNLITPQDIDREYYGDIE